MPESIRVIVAPGAVTALRYPATEPAAPLTLVLAHGAGAPQTSAFMVDFAQALAHRGFPTVTFNFPYMEEGRRLPDRSSTLEACFRAVIAAVRQRPDAGAGRLVIGGKSLGGRMASHVAVQGARDAFGTPEELAPILAPLGPTVRVHVVADGDHSFKVPKRGPVPQPQVFARVQDEVAGWLRGLG